MRHRKLYKTSSVCPQRHSQPTKQMVANSPWNAEQCQCHPNASSKPGNISHSWSLYVWPLMQSVELGLWSASTTSNFFYLVSWFCQTYSFSTLFFYTFCDVDRILTRSSIESDLPFAVLFNTVSFLDSVLLTTANCERLTKLQRLHHNLLSSILRILFKDRKLHNTSYPTH